MAGYHHSKGQGGGRGFVGSFEWWKFSPRFEFFSRLYRIRLILFALSQSLVAFNLVILDLSSLMCGACFYSTNFSRATILIDPFESCATSLYFLSIPRGSLLSEIFGFSLLSPVLFFSFIPFVLIAWTEPSQFISAWCSLSAMHLWDSWAGKPRRFLESWFYTRDHERARLHPWIRVESRSFESLLDEIRICR